MAKIPILGQFDSVTEDKILAVSEQIAYKETTVAQELEDLETHVTEVTDGLDNRLDTLEDTTIPAINTSVANQIIAASNVILEPSRWSSSEDETYPYKAVIHLTNVSTDHFPMVQFRDSDTATYDFSPVATSGSGTVTVLCKQSPSTDVVVTNILCIRATVVTAT